MKQHAQVFAALTLSLFLLGCVTPPSGGQTGSGNATVKIAPVPPSTLKISAAGNQPPQCVIGQACNVPFATASGGTPPYSFTSDSFAAGATPMGLIIDLNGHIVGKLNPNLKPGQYTVRVCVKDAALDSDCTDEVFILNSPSPAWTLTGHWSGPVTFQDNFANPLCKYEGRLDLDLQEAAYDNAVPLDQRGKVTGSSVITVTTATKLVQGFGTPPCLPAGKFPAQQVAGEFKTGHLTIGNDKVQYTGDVNGGQLTLSWTAGTVGQAMLTKQNP